MMTVKDLTGKRFGRLVVQKANPNFPRNRFMQWICLCDCGNTISTRGHNLRTGDTKSCGCYLLETRGKSRLKHGKTETVEYHSWCHIKARCTNPSHKFFSRYGGRGIKVCDRWMNDFSAFLEDMGPRPEGCRSIDRINNDKDYEPGNCRWATNEVQANNKSTNVIVIIRGKKMTLAEAVNAFGNIAYSTALKRIRSGWDAEIAVTASDLRRSSFVGITPHG